MTGQEPLYYAIIRLFLDGRHRSASNVIDDLKPLYGSYKLLSLKDVDEALATAKENGLLDEVDYSLSSGNLVVMYGLTEFGRSMIEKYL